MKDLALINNEDWYKTLVLECKAIITEAVFTSRWALVEGNMELGKRIREDINFKEYSKGNKRSVQDLARNIGQSERTLYYALQLFDIYKSVGNLPEGKNISMNKLITKYLPLYREEMIKNFEYKELPENLQIINGDFRQQKIKESSIDCIITDPPYPEEFLPLYEDLANFANKVLKPSKFCIAYSGHIHLDKVINLMSKYLQYYWIFAMYQPGPNKLIFSRDIMTRWKPILIFQKPPFKTLDYPIQDYIISEKREKSDHEWQQSESAVKNLIEQFTEINEIICDPFSGSGTFSKVAHELKRKAIGIEIDTTTYKISLQRIYG